MIVERSVQDGVATVLINRPEARNAINLEVVRELGAALDALAADDAVRAVVLAGAGGRFFVSGADIAELRERTHREAFFAINATLFQKVEDFPRPTIAAIEGFALAGGLELALGCDLLVAAENVKLGIPEAGVGLFAAGGAVFRLPRWVPYAVAMEMALTADPITAQQAKDYGLLSRVTEKGKAVDAALELAERIAKNAPLSVAASKTIVRNTQGMTDEEAWEYQKPFVRSVFSSEDAKEGPKAFAEKRAPSWPGR